MINVAAPWISTKGVVSSVPKNFQALQHFLTEQPSGLSNDIFKDSTGTNISDYKTQHQKKQISKDIKSLANSTVAPFNLPTFFALEAGDSSKDKLLERLYSEFGDQKFAEIRTAIDNNEFSEEQITELREEITEQMEELLGPLALLAIDIPLLSDLENAVADLALGDEVEALRESAANMELNESLFENVCEAI